MDEQEFDALFQQPFGTKDAARVEAQFRRRMTLAIALFGRTPEDLRRQLAAPHPDIPPGYALDDLRELERQIQMVEGWVLSRLYPNHPLFAIVVGTQSFTAWEACCEIVRRAIEYLENR